VNVYKAYAAFQQMRGFRKAAQLPYFFTALRETGHRFRSII
jgi:hypothetical protein